MQLSRVSCCVVALFLAASSVAADDIARTTTTPFSQAEDEDPCAHLRRKGRLSRYSALACWLQNLRIPLPNQSFREGIIHLSLKDFVCSNFSIAGLESVYVPSSESEDEDNDDSNNTNNTTNPQLHVSLNNVSAICHGSYDSSGFLSGNVQAMAGARHADTPALQFSWNLVAAPLNHSFVQPIAMKTVDCQTQIAVTDLHFSGSISARTPGRTQAPPW